MARTFRNVPARRRRTSLTSTETTLRRLARLARRDAYREARLEAAPAPLWVVAGDWDGFGVWPLRPGRRVGAGESLLSDPGDAAHMNGAIIYWEV